MESTDTFSSMMRSLNKKDPNKALKFMKKFKEAFDEAMDQNMEDHQNLALLEAKSSLFYKNDRLDKLSSLMILGKTTNEIANYISKLSLSENEINMILKGFSNNYNNNIKKLIKDAR